ncbi:MAG: hypothetical protein H7X99_01970 [Saprospiraceae bacterium]|nr:hypothetical protein [Saprospiraceae bacterium]
MKSIVQSLFFIPVFITFCACGDSGPHPSDMVGHYTVTAALDEDAINKTAIRDSIQTAMQHAEDEISKAKEELEKELNLNDIDTTSIEGKLEFSTKKFGKSMADIGINMGELGQEMGNLFSDLAADGINLSESILKNINLDVELLPDGYIRAKGSLISLGLKDAKWQVVGDHFLLKTNETDGQDTFKINSRTNDGFVLEKDKLQITFLKKAK